MPDVTPELAQAKARAEERLLALPGVTGVDIGYKEVGGEPTDRLAIRVLVAEKKPLAEVPKDERVPEEIDGMPSDVIQRRYELHTRAAVGDVLPVDGGSYRPVRGGTSVGPCRAIDGFVHAGTLGALVIDNRTGEFLALSNFHVLAVDGAAAAGDTMTQPSRMDGGRCPADQAGALVRHALTGTVDAAVMSLAPAPGPRPEVVEIGTLTGVGTAAIGQVVHKRGRTTRLTHGVVESVNLTVRLDYGHDIGERLLTDQIGVRPAGTAKFSAHGDSGAVLVDDTRAVVGLLFGGSPDGHAVVNPIADVLAALDVRLAAEEKRFEVVDGRPLSDEKDAAKDFKDDKGEDKEVKDDKDKQEKDEFKESKDEWKENKDDKDTKDKDKDDKDRKDFQAELPFGAAAPVVDPVARRIGALEAAVGNLTRVTKQMLRVEVKDLKPEVDVQYKPEPERGRIPDPLTSPVDRRIAALEASVRHLQHFISRSLRPDLSRGALHNEQE